MESANKIKETVFSSSSSFHTQISTPMGSNNDNSNMMPILHHELVSTNSIELNTAASLSDDSGIPQTTNSSISSSDSYRLGVYKLEVEMIESDGEVSQFDSLDNCSEGGMSAENFNTLKKVPLAPIDPPPEFQDSPKATLIRKIPKNLVSSLRRWTSSQSSFEHLKDHESVESLKAISNGDFFESSCVSGNYENSSFQDDDKTLKDSYGVNKHLYASDSILTGHSDNIYDEPNNITSSSLGNSFDIIESDSSSNLPPPSPISSVVKVNQSLCPYFQDHTRYFKAIPSDQDRITTQKYNSSAYADGHNYEVYCATKRSTCHQSEHNSQNKHLYSPFNNAHYCNHAGVISYGNRPLSRNSLNSRLSSSHNSLSVPSANKADDSIFITQAMSHDALLTKEITDFYNVPLDSDIYALPVDMIRSEKIGNDSNTINAEKKCNKIDDITFYQKSHHRSNRNKRRKKLEATIEQNKNLEKQKFDSNTSKMTYRSLIAPNLSEIGLQNGFTTMQEPLHMTLNEAKQLYQSFYSNSQTESFIQSTNTIEIETVKLSNETIWSVSSTRSHSEISTKEKNAINLKTDNMNNNNNVKQNSENIGSSKPSQSEKKVNELQKSTSTVNKQNNQFDKKPQFHLNLKQKFCSIFRFRRNYNRCRNRNSTQLEQTKESNYFPQEENKKKFQSRALPPVPKKNEVQSVDEGDVEVKRTETQPFHFTTSIEKVKDYGWYWGPLSCEAAEKVLSNEPDGSFIVRDSSDDHYIFSLSFKLNNCVRHVRIEQDQGTFSFGSYAKFKSQTITEFIEKAVEHSRSGRYLFFLHRRPEHGPMRVQLTNPVSRFKHVQSLQHMCRFVILKAVVRKDLVQTLPLPRRLLDYLSYKHCYSEQVESDSSQSQISGEGTI